MVQTKEVVNLKKQVKRLKARLVAVKSGATSRELSNLRAENKALKQKTKRLEERLKNVNLAVVQRKRLREKTERLERQVVNQKDIKELKRVVKRQSKQLAVATTPKRGPKPAPYSRLSDNAKYKRARATIRDVAEPTDAGTAVKLALSARIASGDNDRRWLARDVESTGPKAVRSELFNGRRASDQTTMTPIESLALCSQLGLTQRGTQLLHNKSKLHGQNGASILPTKTLRQVTRVDCLPSDLVADSVRASVPVENVIIHTTSRLPPVHDAPVHSGGPRYFFISFKGCIDGSGSHNLFRHCEDEERRDEGVDYSQLLVSSIMPMLMERVVDGVVVDVVWFNERPGGSQFLRPVEIQHFAESKVLVSEQYAKLAAMNGYTFQIGSDTFEVKMDVTGLDGKVRNYISGNRSSCSCGICGASPTRMGGTYKDHVENVPSLKKLLMGCSPLHLRLRTMETLLKMGVKLTLGGGYTVYGKKGLNLKKQDDMRQKLKDRLVELDHLIKIDRAQHGRVGNVGNCARAFMDERNHAGVAQILGLPEELIRRVAGLLLAVHSPKMMDVGQYKDDAKLVFDMYNKLMPSYYMSPSLHVLLVHVPQLQEQLNYPISRTTEECIESMHRIFRKAIMRHTNPSSARTVMLTLMRHMLIISDPLVVSAYHYATVKHRDIPAFARHLIALDDEVVNDVEDGDGGVDEVWYSRDLEMCSRERLRLMRLED